MNFVSWAEFQQVYRGDDLLSFALCTQHHPEFWCKAVYKIVCSKAAINLALRKGGRLGIKFHVYYSMEGLESSR